MPIILKLNVSLRESKNRPLIYNYNYKKSYWT